MKGRKVSYSCLVVGLLGFGVAGSAQTPPETETVQLVVETPPDILISRLNPPVLELLNPFESGEVITTNASGELWKENPEFYYVNVAPVVWHLEVPAATELGSYDARIQATFSLCSSTQGFCFTDQQTAVATVQVGSTAENTPVVLELSGPD